MSRLYHQKLKQKIEPSVTTETTTSTGGTPVATTASETIFNFTDKDQHTGSKNSKTNNNSGGGAGAGGGGGGGGNAKHNPLPSLSVQIVQQISGHPQQDTSQTIHTNVTVSSLYGNSNSPNQGGASHSVLTSVQCKQEPSDDSIRTSSSNNINTPTSSSSVHNSQLDHSSVGDLGIHNCDIDEIQDILDSIEKEDNIEPSLLRDLNEFNEIYVKVQRDSESNESANMFGSLACVSPGLSSKTVYSNLGPGGSLSSIYDTTENMTNPIPEPTGPAAETLKQMAAQHQHQHSPGYPMDHFSNGGFPPNYSQLYCSVPNTPSPFPYSHQACHHLGDASQMTPDMVYGSTKPLTHYTTEQSQHNSPSSLQQLQNQVQSHFKPSPGQATPHQMQIIQSQQLQVTHGSHSMQMSQSQQVQMQPSSQPISLSQQQTFNMNQQQMVNEQMKMQMMEKMRMEQQQQGRMPPQYMNRPPPEYKMHNNSRSQGSFPSSTPTAGNANPLQTMQNMVNQTTAYGNVKSEVAGTAPSSQSVNGMMQSSQMTAMQQQQSLSSQLPSNNSHIGNISQVTPNVPPGFQQQQQMQQPPAYSEVDSASRNSSSTYTSAIMRNQRPPNMNVGPDGLNIAQPRTHTDWPRAPMINSQHSGIRPVMPAATHGMAQSSMSSHMMQYQRSPHYGNGPTSVSMATATASSMAQMQQQQQVRAPMPGQMNRVGHGMMPSAGQMVMQQHQSMQVTQMNVHGASPSYSMGGPSPGATNTGYSSMGVPSPGATNTGYSMGGPSPGATNTGYSMGGPSPGATTNPDEFFHFLEDILN
uniref:Neurogenic mastermind-like N-terminal domain-containing protein n=1 Tax=Biomphalaria glabrata TaxID=6526 RepID=A0A2C9M198_BIOGL